MNISKILGTALTSLTLTIPTAKAENQIGGAIYNSIIPQKISLQTSKIAKDIYESATTLSSKSLCGNQVSGGVIGDFIPTDSISTAQLQIYGAESLTNNWNCANIVKLSNDITNVTKIVNSALKVGDDVKFTSTVYYGNNQTTNVLVSGLSKAYRFFKTTYHRMSGKIEQK